MHNGENNNSSAPELAPLASEELSKDWYRKKVWRHLEKNGLSSFPKPVYNRIPNFKGSEEAAQSLCQLDIFKSAENIEVSAERPQEAVRFEVLKAGKNLFVPILSLKEGLMSQIIVPDDHKPLKKKIVSVWGTEKYGKKIGINEQVTLDLVVIGSVAVSRNGDRIGKGRGYSSLEFGILSQMKAINPNTVVVTTVHDCQVFDTIPSELFEPHDVSVDIIVTPTQVIETSRSPTSLGKPTGVIWSYLSNRKLTRLPIVQELREKEMLAGQPCILKEEDTDSEEVIERQIRTRPYRRRRFIHRNNPKSESEQNEVSNSQPRPRQYRRPRRRTEDAQRISTSEPPSGDGTGTTAPDTTTQRPKKSRKPRPPIIFSIKVSNIEKSARRQDLRKALDERGVKPQFIRWLGYRGFCLLHFSKPNTAVVEDVSEFTLESVCEALSDLSIIPSPAEPNQPLSEPVVPNKLLVEPAKFRTKIETAEVTAV